ncbi:hypothetical protein [Tissierella pigra]|nr:hypothetical protein [Tissierella pigra]
MKICENCKWIYKEHCSNGRSDKCCESVSENDTCLEWEGEKNDHERSN